MIVVVSDLHFEEEQSDVITGDDNAPAVAYSRNLPGKVYRSFVNHLAQEAVRNKARQLDLVFAGDVFDLHRTSLWFQANGGKLRPYVNNGGVDEQLERLVQRIVARIQSEDEVGKALSTFRLLAGGKYWFQGEQDFPVPVSIHFIPGNHDRLLNATPAIRRTIREALALPDSDEPFPHLMGFPEEGVLIRHGHEYDRYNFGLDFTEDEVIPTEMPAEGYDESPFGDYATIDIAARIPHLFRQFHGDDRIRRNAILSTVYQRFLEFDDLRPQRAMFNFLLNITEQHIEPLAVWQAIEPVVYLLLEELHGDPNLESWLDKMDTKWQLDTIDVVQTALAMKSWRLAGIPLSLAQYISNSIIAGRDDALSAAKKLAARESAIRGGEYRFLVAGHTHVPAVELIASDARGERYYINTGTWRNRIPATPDFNAFGRLKALTYVIFYGPEEDPVRAEPGGQHLSMDYWTGFTQRWLIRGL